MVQKKQVKKIDIALQGGGAHGAYTWGVLERILEEERLEIEGLCGTSAGAMNATVAAHGMQLGGRQGAIDLLHTFWKRISDEQQYSWLKPSYWDKHFGNGDLFFSPAYFMFDLMTLMMSPYQFNPLDINPLKDILLDLVDFDMLTSCHETKLFVCATNVKTSRARVFPLKEISIDAVLASACLPFLYKTVEIDGEGYWDGGYMGNPPLFPLIDGTNTEDILIVQINPIEIDEIPKTVDDIRDRVNELNFNASLMLEMRRIHFVQKLMREGHDLGHRVRNLYIHSINPEEFIAHLNVSSKLNADWNYLRSLHDIGYRMADEWIEENFDKVGKMDSVDIDKVFL